MPKETLLAAIKHSIGSTMFRNLYARVGGVKQDLLRDGDLSCAFYASSLLALTGLIESPHATVDSTLRDMKRSGWFPLTRPRVGCVIVWGERHFTDGNESHKHIGFYLGNGVAVSNSDKKRAIAKHPYRSHNRRPVVELLWHPTLGA